MKFLYIFFLLSVMSTAKKVVLVTGGNKGIGKGIVSELLKQKSDVHVILGSRDLERGTESARDIIDDIGGDISNRISVVQLDVTDDSSVTNAAAKVSESHGKIYGVINNAGVGFNRSPEETCATNVYGLVWVVDEC